MLNTVRIKDIEVLEIRRELPMRQSFRSNRTRLLRLLLILSMASSFIGLIFPPMLLLFPLALPLWVALHSIKRRYYNFEQKFRFYRYE